MSSDERLSALVAWRSGARRHPLVLGAVGILVMVLLIAGIGALRRSGDQAPARRQAREEATARSVEPLDFVLGTIDPNGTAPPAQPVIDAVLAQLDAWGNSGILGPLRAGTEPPPLPELFTAAALPAATTTERDTVFVTGVPRSKVDVDRANVSLGTVAGPDGGTAVVVATVDLRLVARAGVQRITVVRTGEVVLVPEADGSWRIDGWALHAAEDSL